LVYAEVDQHFVPCLVYSLSCRRPALLHIQIKELKFNYSSVIPKFITQAANSRASKQ
jgi:hypothetical protein